MRLENEAMEVMLFRDHKSQRRSKGYYNGAVQHIGKRDIATGDTGAIRKYGAEDDRIKAVEVSGQIIKTTKRMVYILREQLMKCNNGSENDRGQAMDGSQLLI